MQRLQAFKYELMPGSEQQRDMRRFAGSCRFVYNKALAMQKSLYEQGATKQGYAGLCKSLLGWKAEATWLAETPSQALQQTLKDLERAYSNFFAKRADFPRFKKKGMGDSFRYPQGCKLDQPNSRIFLPKLGWIRYRNSRDVLGEVRNVTVSHSSGKWFVSIQTQREVEQPLPAATSAIGIDVGIVRFATMSDGSFVAPLNSFKKHQQRLARYQRRMSHKAKCNVKLKRTTFSSNWKKAKLKVQQIHNTIANARKDFLHK
ncbi:transposase, partial [Undibacterium sp. LX40W]|uniref:RNA-guided endonuclease InsQ/TnpB family protein n=1 Tax=Undibacterium sp. LX40W TaxID=2762299 RepID=UPI00164AC749